MKSKKAIVIGAGVAGMAIAIRLAIKGFNVDLFEKNSEPGGKLTTFENNGFKFDAGPSLFTSPQFLQDLFNDAEENIETYINYQKQPIVCKYFYEDGTIVNAFADSDLFSEELHNKLGESKLNIKQYLAKAEQLYTKTGIFFLTNSLHKFKSYCSISFLKAFSGTSFKHISSSLYAFNKAYFANSKTVQLFNRFATYNGSNPYKAPAMLSLISHLEHNDGVYYPKGGMISITNALYALAKTKGVCFHFNTPVDSIIVNGNIAHGIVAKNVNHYAATVVSNGDIYFTYKNLLKNNVAANKILRKERSSSALIFYWGMCKTFDELNLHNIFFSEDYKAEFESIFNSKECYKDPTIYINITAKCEPEIQAPQGKENWFVMINVPSSSAINWNEAIVFYKQQVLQKLNRILQTKLEDYIETENILHPNLIEANTASYLGSLYGTSSNSKLAAFLRHPNFLYSIKGLYFVGGSVHPGGGIPLCLQSAKITSDIILQKQFNEA